LGAITLASESPARRYSTEDIKFAEELARRAALSLDNARLHSDTESALQEVQSKTDEIYRLNSELEQRVRDRTEQLEIALKELEAFTYSISDDMRGPLRAIDGFSRVLMEEYPGKLDAEGQRLLNVIRDNAATMGQLIDGLLRFSHVGRQALEQSDIDMEELARSVFDEVQTNDKHRVNLEVKSLLPAFADRNMVRQVLSALVSNGFKFTRPLQNPTLEIGVKEKVGNQNVYYVRDNGVGFDMQYSDKLFGVFQRLHGADEFEGTGVGLALVQRIIMRHCGRVWAESKVGQGATVYFSLPAA
jgi:light-regulated signal transduction histidine kinase (bacteriophytochrome)